MLRKMAAVSNSSNFPEVQKHFSSYTFQPNNELNLIATDLSSEKEAELQTFLKKRLETWTGPSDLGNLCTLDFLFHDTEEEDKSFPVCYYTLLQKPISSNIHTSTDTSNRFIVCFLTGAQVNLEFFQSELQEFCKGLMPCLDSNVEVLNQNHIIETYLSTWYHVALKYLCRCLQLLDLDIAVLFYLASTNCSLEVVGGDTEIRNDIPRFVTSCSITEVIGAPKQPLIEIDDMPQTHATLTLNSDGSYTFSGVDLSEATYCKEWAKLMLGGERDNPTFLKSVIENFKLNTIQGMNTFKRLLTEAETDYYALYRVYLFLKNSKQGQTLVHYAKSQESISTRNSILDILEVLEHSTLNLPLKK